MDAEDSLKAEAEAWVTDEIARLRRMSYSELRERLDEPKHLEMIASSGKRLILETQVLWDGGREGPLRVIVDVWDPRPGGRRRWRPTNSLAIDDFIRAPDGSFGGEDTPRDSASDR